MNAMRAIYIRSMVLVLGFAALLLVEHLASPSGSAAGKAPTVAVGGSDSPA